MNSTETEFSVISVSEMVSILSKSYISLIENNIPFSTFPAVMLWGAPGVGKSQGIREAAELLQKKTGKKVEITDVRLLLFNPVDLRGIPTANEDKTLAVWLKPKIFQMDESTNTVNILFLDEISAAPPAVQAAAYQITLDRTVGEHKLPENCIVIAAGNRVTDKSVAYNMPKALANRFCHFEIKADSSSWHDWAVKSGISEYVTGYIEYNPSALLKADPAGTSLAFPTPRSWEMVSRIMNNVSDNTEAISPMINGCIGKGAAAGFRAWSAIYKSLPSVEAIFSGIEAAIPEAEEHRIALRSVMVKYATLHPQKELIDNSVDYACLLPWSFRKKLFHDYCLIPEVRAVIKENSVFKAAVRDGLK